MKIWMSNNAKNSNHYTARLVLPLIGVIIIMPIVMYTSILLAAEQGWSIKLISMIDVIVFTPIIIYLALYLGRIANRDALIFCQDDEHNLFVVNARDFTSSGRGLLGYISKNHQTQKVLENLKETGSGYSARCKVHYANGSYGKRTYLIENGCENQNELITTLERKRNVSSPEVKTNRNPLFIFISGLVLAACITVCIMSHQNVGILDVKIYFPFLWISYIPLSSLLYFIIKQRRGE